MISTFSGTRYLIRRLPHPRSCFFKGPQFQGLLGNDFFQLPCLAAKGGHLASRRRTSRIARKPSLASFHVLSEN
jgi:hypothetical protein